MVNNKLVFGFVLLLVMAAPFIMAQDEELIDAGTNPDSALYGVDLAMERVSLALFYKEK